MNKEKAPKVRRWAVVAAMCAALMLCAAAFAGCGTTSDQSLGEGVAATVNGDAIMEDEVTQTITAMREGAGLTDDTKWAAYLSAFNATPADLRTNVINSLAEQRLKRNAAADLGIAIDDATVSAYVQQNRAGMSDEKWRQTLAASGMTEESYRDSVESTLLDNAINDYFKTQAEQADEQDLLPYVQQACASYNGSKHVSVIQFVEGDDATAQTVHDLIASGDSSFARAALLYSTDQATATNGGDVGWITPSSGEAYASTALQLGVGELSDVVQGDGALYLVTVTEEFTVPGTLTSYDQVPAALLNDVLAVAKQYKAADDLSTWENGIASGAKIVIADMPEGLPYDVDLSQTGSSSQAAQSASSGASSSAATAGSTQAEG